MYVITIILYISILLYVGARKALSVKNQADFALAGRRLSTFVLVGTLLATWIGTGSIFGQAEETYRVGVAAYVLPLSDLLGILALILLASRIRRVGQITVQDLLEIRYGVVARIFGTATLVLAYVIIISYQYRAGAAVVERLVSSESMAHSIAHVWIVWGVALVVIVYTALAGMYSVAYTDVANGILMLVGLTITLPFIFMKAGGFEGIQQGIPADQLHFWGTYSMSDYIGIILPPCLLLLGDANMYSRFFSAKDGRSAKVSAIWLLFGVLFVDTLIISIALIGKVLHPDLANPGHIVVEIAFYSLPPVLGALLIATILAVIVSTADSFLLAPSSALVRDIYQRFLRPDASEKQLVFMSRLLVVVLGLIALGLAFLSKKFFDVAWFAYTIYGVGITPPLIAAFLWKRGNAWGAMSSIFAGVSCALAWRLFHLDENGLDFGGLSIPAFDAVIPSFLLAILTLVIVSSITSPPHQESWSPFFEDR